MVLGIKRLVARQPFFVFQEKRARRFPWKLDDQRLFRARDAVGLDRKRIIDALIAVGEKALKRVDVLLDRLRLLEV